MKFVLFDVGANYGWDSWEPTMKNPHYLTYAFEPTPELVTEMRNRSTSFADRYNVIQMAVSDYDGEAEFNIASHADWGVSSLLSFSDEIKQSWPPERWDLYYDRKEKVQVTRLDTWINTYKPPIEQIDFFHCDTQGTDLRVLKGMGEYFPMIVAGCIEVPISRDVMLYKDQHTKEECLDFFNDWGYEVYNITHQTNEENLYFRKKTPQV